MSSPKGGKTQQVTNTTELPAYVQDAQQNYLNTVRNFTAPFTGAAPANTVASLTNDQLASADYARSQLSNEFANPYDSSNLSAANNAQEYSGVMTGQPVGVDPASGQVTGAAIRGLLNPYTKDVLDPTIAAMRRQLGITQAGIGAHNASAAAFGGSRGALQSAEADRAFGDQVALTTAQLMAAGYDKATATALANAQNRQAANTFNASTANAATEANAGREQQAVAANAGAMNNMRQFNSGLLQSGALARNTLENDEASRRRSALAQLLGIGGLEQQNAQGNLDQYTNMVKLLGSSIPGNYGATSTQTSPNNAPSTLQTIGGLGLGILGLGTGGGGSLGGSLLSSIFSDRRDKTDIKKIGNDPDSGLDIYAYRYKTDPKTYPKTVGPMAQDIEKKYPGAVHEIGGHKVVDGNALRSMLGLR